MISCIITSKNTLLSKHQSGFRSLHSIVTALIEATDDWSLIIMAILMPLYF